MTFHDYLGSSESKWLVEEWMDSEWMCGIDLV